MTCYQLCMPRVGHDVEVFFLCILVNWFTFTDENMSDSVQPPIEVRDCGTQLRDRHLAPHLRNFEVVNPSETTIAEERTHTLPRRLQGTLTRKVSVQTGRFGSTSKKSVLKCVSVSTSQRPPSRDWKNDGLGPAFPTARW